MIITVSDFVKSDLVSNFKVPAGKVVRIYPGLNETYKVKEFKKPSKPFVLYLGVIEPRKNIVGLIRAFNLLKQNRAFRDLDLVIAGSFGWLIKDILKEKEQSPFSQNIYFLNEVSEEKALELYNTASVFVYPSFYEGFGFPPLEAQACGLAVVASENSVFEETLGKSALLVNPFRVYELASAIEAVLTNRNLSLDLRKKGLENVKRFNWSKSIDELILCLRLFQ